MNLTLLPSDATNLAGLPPEREHLSHSSLGMQNNCKRKYELHYIERLEPILRPRPLGMGKAFQLAIEHQDPNAGVRALAEEALDQPTIDHDQLLIEQAIVRAGAKLYLKRWPATPVERREFEYRVRLRNPWTGHYSNTFDLLGYADGIIDGPHLELVENKHVGQITNLTIRKLKLDRQVSLACYGLWRATGRSVRIVHYRFIRKPSIKQRKDETLDQFCDRITADYAEREDFYAVEESLFRSDEDLLRIEAELWVWADELRTARRRELYPRNTSFCAEYGGCPFLDICTGDPDAMSLYRKRPEREEIAA